jgi:hypothetical protein
MEVAKNQNLSIFFGYLLEPIIENWQLVELFFRNLASLGHFFLMENKILPIG